MHWITTVLLFLLKAAPWHQCPTFACATFLSVVPLTEYTCSRPKSLNAGWSFGLLDPFITVTAIYLPSLDIPTPSGVWPTLIVSTMRGGFASVDDHLAALASVAEALDLEAGD